MKGTRKRKNKQKAPRQLTGLKNAILRTDFNPGGKSAERAIPVQLQDGRPQTTFMCLLHLYLELLTLRTKYTKEKF